jgi:hypothetical protein
VHINPDDPWDATIFTCITTTFYSIARLGEFTVPAIRTFDPAKHITQDSISETTDLNGLPVTKFHIPSMKMSPVEGGDAYWSKMDSQTQKLPWRIIFESIPQIKKLTFSHGNIAKD